MAAIPGRAVLDGEIVCLDSAGKPLFFDIMKRRPACFAAFDLLWTEGRDLRKLPLLEWKAELCRLVRPPVVYVQHITGAGVDLFETVCRGDMEGIVAKLAAGRYEPEATTWVKIKNRTHSQAEGRAEFFEGRELTPRAPAELGLPAVAARQAARWS